MAYDTGERYLKEIDHVSILEPIDEVFDGATSLLTENAVMYGSTVTAILAGLPIVGDLDVAVSNQEFMKLCQNFSSSVKWLQVEGSNIPERDGGSPRGWRPPPTLKPSRYDDEGGKHLPIDQVIAFQTVNSARVQIMQSKSMTGDHLEDALEVVRKVDFTFCGMALDRWGRLLETIPHAYDDCMSRVIRIKDYQPRLDPTRLKQRIRKYVKRGWSLTFSIDQAMANLARARALEAKKPKKKHHGKKKGPSCFRIKRSTAKGIIIECRRLVTRRYIGESRIRDVVGHFAKNNVDVTLSSTMTKLERLHFWEAPGSKRKLTENYAQTIIQSADSYLKRNNSSEWKQMFGEDKKSLYGELKMKEKKKVMTKAYYNYGSSTSTTSSSNW